MTLTADRILTFLRDDLDVDTEGVELETALFSSGRVDSLAMVDLMAFLEREGRFHLDIADVTLENLDTVGRMLTLVAERAARG
ncbi:MAG: acyl carrier protein [Alphaproteobacteria bacterium]|nr:acyl carrier protein [Alphaproteobacteria bacterium]MCB9695733.1 acyl carrier protein [Alphaproteobacteria bacterium]